MTFAYSVTLSGMVKQIKTVGREIKIFARQAPCVYGLKPNDQPTCSCGAFFLAQKVNEACELILPEPTRIMKFIRELSEYCTDNERPLEWVSPTGFPVANRYNISNKELVYGTEDGCDVKYTVANGVLPKIREPKARNSSAPNYIHSRDAAYLIKVVNAANAEGIPNLVTVHDAFACHAPQAQRFGQIIREQLSKMYIDVRVLFDLRNENIRANDKHRAPPPASLGPFDPREVRAAEYLCS
jgi:Autographiviridae RNA polymerase